MGGLFVPVKPINVVAGLIALSLLAGLICLMVRFAFGFAAFGKVAIAFVLIAFLIGCIPLVFSVFYIAYDRVQTRKGN